MSKLRDFFILWGHLLLFVVAVGVLLMGVAWLNHHVGAPMSILALVLIITGSAAWFFVSSS